MLELPEGTSLQLRISGEGDGFRLEVIASITTPGSRRAHMEVLDSRFYDSEPELWRGIQGYGAHRLAELAP